MVQKGRMQCVTPIEILFSNAMNFDFQEQIDSYGQQIFTATVTKRLVSSRCHKSSSFPLKFYRVSALGTRAPANIPYVTLIQIDAVLCSIHVL